MGMDNVSYLNRFFYFISFYLILFYCIVFLTNLQKKIMKYVRLQLNFPKGSKGSNM